MHVSGINCYDENLAQISFVDSRAGCKLVLQGRTPTPVQNQIIFGTYSRIVKTLRLTMMRNPHVRVIPVLIRTILSTVTRTLIWVLKLVVFLVCTLADSTGPQGHPNHS